MTKRQKKKTIQKSNLWVEKYRPNTIDECLLPQRYRQALKGFLARDEFPNLLLSGQPGIGKTSIAQAIINDFHRDSFTINSTIEPNVDTIRERVIGFAANKSLGGRQKAIVFDEAEYLNKVYTQPALSRCIEQFPACRYILTCNEPEKLIPRLKSRLMEFDFEFSEDEQQELLELYVARAEQVLELEGIGFIPGDAEHIVRSNFPDLRKTLNELHRSSVTGKLTPFLNAA